MGYEYHMTVAHILRSIHVTCYWSPMLTKYGYDATFSHALLAFHLQPLFIGWLIGRVDSIVFVPVFLAQGFIVRSFTLELL